MYVFNHWTLSSTRYKNRVLFRYKTLVAMAHSGYCLLCSSLICTKYLWSALLGVLGASFLWGIGELISQEKRVLKGWFPMNPKRKEHYEKLSKDESICPCKHKK